MITALLFSTFLHAQTYRGPVSSALGGSGVAGMPAAEASLLNPALIAIFPGASVDVSYRDGSLDQGEHRQALAIGAIDNGKEELFSGALHYARTRSTGLMDQPVDGELWHLGLGSRVSEKLALGASLYRQVDRPASGAPKSTTQWNYGFGALFMATPWLGAGYVMKNLALPSDETPEGVRLDLYHALGLHVGLGEFARLRFDLGRRERHNPAENFAYLFGFETKTNDFFLLRFGFRHDEAGDGRLFTAGLGFDGPRLKFDYALEVPAAGGDGALHSVDLRIPF